MYMYMYPKILQMQYIDSYIVKYMFLFENNFCNKLLLHSSKTIYSPIVAFSEFCIAGNYDVVISFSLEPKRQFLAQPRKKLLLNFPGLLWGSSAKCCYNNTLCLWENSGALLGISGAKSPWAPVYFFLCAQHMALAWQQLLYLLIYLKLMMCILSQSTRQPHVHI